MKIFKTAMILVLCSQGVAFAGDRLVCNEYSRTTQNLKQTTVVLSPLNDGASVSDGDTEAYQLEIFKGISEVPELSVPGIVSQEDVVFEFVSKDKKTEFTVYLDEMTESSLTVKGKQIGNYICR